jgi:hypothetical protein
MLKTVSAALLAVSMFAVPAFAATSQKTTPAPVAKSDSAIKPMQSKKAAPNVNANASSSRHHVRHSTHQRSHKKIAAHKMHKTPKVAAKHVTHPAKRG